MTDILEIFKAYNGTGYYCILFMAAIIYLWFTEEDNHIRVLLVIVPAIIQCLFFVPYFYMAYNRLDEGTFYRILWLLPMTLVIAYACCRIIGNHTRLGVICMAVLLALSGTCVYTSDIVSFAENPYNLPDELIELCDMVKPDEGEERVWVAFPPVLVHFVRQYTTDIMLPFGRDSMVDSWKRLDNPLYNLYMSPCMPASDLAKSATDYSCHYIVVDRDADILGDIRDFDFAEYGSTENYIVYRNNNVPLWNKGDEQDGSYMPYPYTEYIN